MLDESNGLAMEYESSKLARVKKDIEVVTKIGDLNPLKILGKGSFGVVSVVQHKTTGELYALKKIGKYDVDENGEIILENEFSLLKDLFHENIVKVFDCRYSSTSVYITMELYTRGNLVSYLNRNHPLYTNDIKRLAKQMVDASVYLTDNSIAHRDIKLDNYVLDEFVNVKLCDFGLAVKGFKRRSTMVGTYRYAAPQLAKGNYNPFSADVWSIGVSIFLLFGNLGLFPCETFEELQQLKEPLTIKWPYRMPTLCKHLLMKMIAYEEEKRINIYSTQKHCWLETDSKIERWEIMKEDKLKFYSKYPSFFD